LIQYAVEEAIAAGARELIFVTGRGKRAIEDHFDRAVELENELAQRGSMRMLGSVRNIIPASVSCVYVRQPQALGLGHAILCAEPVVGDNPFAVVLADDLIDAKVPVLKQMTRIFASTGKSVIAVQRIARAQAGQYGVVALDRGSRPPHVIRGIVEKPAPARAPSTLGVVGRYILSARIFHHLRKVRPGSGGELQLTDGIAGLLEEDAVLAHQFEGERYDCGSKLGYLEGNVAYALRHPDIGRELFKYLKNKYF
jgi:UTP--glucose-1-phosphate uridylyltransferase